MFIRQRKSITKGGCSYNRRENNPSEGIQKPQNTKNSKRSYHHITYSLKNKEVTEPFVTKFVIKPSTYIYCLGFYNFG